MLEQGTWKRRKEENTGVRSFIQRHCTPYIHAYIQRNSKSTNMPTGVISATKKGAGVRPYTHKKIEMRSDTKKQAGVRSHTQKQPRVRSQMQKNTGVRSQNHITPAEKQGEEDPEMLELCGEKISMKTFSMLVDQSISRDKKMLELKGVKQIGNWQQVQGIQMLNFGKSEPVSTFSTDYYVAI